MSATTAKPTTVKGWHVGVGLTGLMAVTTAIAGDLGQLCTNPMFQQSLIAGNFSAIGLTVLEFLISKAKGQ